MEILVPFGDTIPSSSSSSIGKKQKQQQQRAGMKRKIRDDDWVYDDYKDCSLRLIRSPSSSRVSAAAVDRAFSMVPTAEEAPSSSSRDSMAVDRAFSMVPTTEGAPSSSSRVCWQQPPVLLSQPPQHGQKRKDREWSEGSVHRRDHDDLAADDEDSSIGLLVCPCQLAYDQALAAQMGW